MFRFYTKFVVEWCIVCCDRRHLDKSTSDYIRNTGTQGLGNAAAFWNRSCVLKSQMRFEIAAAFWNRRCVLKSQLRFEIADAFWNRSCDSNAAAFSECDISSGFSTFWPATYKRVHFDTPNPFYKYGHHFAVDISEWISSMTFFIISLSLSFTS